MANTLPTLQSVVNFYKTNCVDMLTLEPEFRDGTKYNFHVCTNKQYGYPILAYPRMHFAETVLTNSARVWVNRKNRRDIDLAWALHDKSSTTPPKMIEKTRLGIIQTDTHIAVVCTSVNDRPRWVREQWQPPKHIPPFTMEGPIVNPYEYSREVEARKQREAAELALGIDPASHIDAEI